MSDNHPELSPYALCSIEDVISYVPGYRTDDATDAKLIALINAESLLVPEQTNRELIGTVDANPRSFDVDWQVWEDRELLIGDASQIDSVTILDANGVTVQTTPAYVAMPRIRKPWEPTTSLWLRPDVSSAAQLARGYVIEVDAVWGFPTIPQFIREACAKRVLLRYLSDVATKGTSLAESIDDVNAAALFASARDAIERNPIPSIG